MKNACFALLLFFAAAYLPPTKACAQQKPRLNHIAVYVSNLQTMSSFYQNVVGLDTIPEPFHDGRHTWFAVAELSHLHLIQGAATVVARDKNAHLCFSVPSVEEYIKTLVKNGVQYENWAGTKNAVTNRVDGVKQIYFQDPENFWIEINDAKD